MDNQPIIAACGNDCSICPRHLPKSSEQLQNTAKLWFYIGYRTSIQSNDEIKCEGCKKGNWCRYNIIECVSSKGLNNCGECIDYPCKAILDAFESTHRFYAKCVEVCTSCELAVMEKAFFEKKKNLDNIRQSPNVHLLENRGIQE